MMSYEQFMQASGAELVCGNIIVGQMANRKKVGDRIDGVFTLNDDGQKLLVELEAKITEAPKIEAAPKGRKKADKADPEAPKTVDLGDGIVIPAITEEDLKV